MLFYQLLSTFWTAMKAWFVYRVSSSCLNDAGAKDIQTFSLFYNCFE